MSIYSKKEELDIEALIICNGSVKIDQLEIKYENLNEYLISINNFWKNRGMEIIKDENNGIIIFKPVNKENKKLNIIMDNNLKTKKLSIAALEVLSIITFHQPVTIQDIEDKRKLKLSKQIIDSLLETGLIRISYRKTNSGRACTYVTTDYFLENYDLSSLEDIPNIEEIEELNSVNFTQIK